MPRTYSKLIKVESNYFKASQLILTCRWVENHCSENKAQLQIGQHQVERCYDIKQAKEKHGTDVSVGQHGYSGTQLEEGLIQLEDDDPGPSVSASPGNLLDMQIIRPQPRPTESKTLPVGAPNLCFNQSSMFENHWARAGFLHHYCPWESPGGSC